MESRRGGKKHEVCELFVGNMISTLSEDELRKLVNPFGAVNEVRVSQGYALLEMSDARGAIRAVEALNGRTVCGRPLKVRVGF